MFSSGCLAACELNKGNQEASAGGWCQLYPPSVELPFLFPSRDEVSLSLGAGSTEMTPKQAAVLGDSRLPWSHSHHGAGVEPTELSLHSETWEHRVGASQSSPFGGKNSRQARSKRPRSGHKEIRLLAPWVQVSNASSAAPGSLLQKRRLAGKWHESICSFRHSLVPPPLPQHGQAHTCLWLLL